MMSDDFRVSLLAVVIEAILLLKPYAHHLFGEIGYVAVVVFKVIT